jgi:hypothetical protein
MFCFQGQKGEPGLQGPVGVRGDQVCDHNVKPQYIQGRNTGS